MAGGLVGLLLFEMLASSAEEHLSQGNFESRADQ